MIVKILTAREAVSLIKDNDTITTSGFVGIAHPEALTKALEARFLETGTPKNLTLVFAAGQGDGKEKGLNHLAYEGLIAKVIGGHWNLVPKLGKLVSENKIMGYNLPQGVISHLFRDIAAKKVGNITHVGLGTFVDPRLEGGKMNTKTTEDIVELVKIDGKELLLYKAFSINIALMRGTTADEKGNITLEKEANSLEATSVAQAVKNSGGKVIVQVERVVKAGILDPKLVKIPGIYVEAIVLAKPEDHMQTFGEQYNPSYTGEIKIPITEIKSLALNEKKIIARRAAMELEPNQIVNLGIGIPEIVARVANEEGIAKYINLTVEAGPIGGIPAGGLSFGAAINPEAILDQPYQFDFYDGGGLDIAYLGIGEIDKEGNVNVSKLGSRVIGCGGFINISQNAKKVVYCGTFTSGGLKINITDGKFVIKKEGKISKFVDVVSQITFSGKYARKVKQSVIYVTERAVFELRDDGLYLTEIAPNINLKKDVLNLMGFKPKMDGTIKLMDNHIFLPGLMGLAI